MKPLTLTNAVSASAYPGRGIICGLNEDKDYAVIAYFIMGRSLNSRNRVFVSDGGDIRTKAYDESQMLDPSLVIYRVLCSFGNVTICTNGDQTDTIHKYMLEGKSPNDALHTREFEPDPPIYTPRVSSVLSIQHSKLQYQLSILKRADDNPASCGRYFYDYAQPVCGVGHFIHTYNGDGDPVPSFEGEPKPVRLNGSIDQIADEIWNGLNEQNKVSLLVRTIELQSGKTATRIINKNQ